MWKFQRDRQLNRKIPGDNDNLVRFADDIGGDIVM